MSMTEAEAEPHFSQPVRQVAQMLIVLGLVAVGSYLLLPTVMPVVRANLWLNGTIGLVFVVGVFTCFWQVYQLVRSVAWLEDFALEREVGAKVPRLLAPLAALLRSRRGRMQISATSSRSILESVATRIEELRDITRYLVNLLIFLGLLGTFYGLATTVPAVVETIRSLAPQEGEGGVEVFSRLMGGLEAQLGGMGTAFGSSLLGLAGSLIVGLLELFASHGQNRFYRELEEWLSSITRVAFAGADGEGAEPSAAAGILDHMAEQMEAMREMFTQSDVSRAILEDKIGGVADAVDKLTETLAAERAPDPLLLRIAEANEALLNKLDGVTSGDGGVDAESRMRLRSIDTQLLAIHEDIAAGRQESVAGLRADISALTRVIREATRRPG
ncbi:biopolymer transporter ExbB [Vannielia litorea]|uniref:biopolymer transporter ExbB n=1 Tax=Vannielia litorea TaxID=1217970 RepID=UPI001C96DA11|nr:biopolymer transporter ExbB [Vannielia litorea]MBY6049857.1 biopolymer transporter ExbB [Vannielia litorea]MBY6077271.1 biopolymer transporter ExbB [Vannielia litorea]